MNNNTIDKTDILSLTADTLAQAMQAINLPKFRAKQIYDWLHKKQVQSFDDMSNLSKDLREKLAQGYYIPQCTMVARQTSATDGTNKFLLELGDGNCIETVWMEYKHGASLCISTQVGCRQGCTFCASTLGGLVRNLSAGEMLGQIYTAQRIMGKKISGLVLMGIGEPLDNFDNVMDFLSILSSENGQNMSLRHVSLSTCGLVPEIERLAEKNLGLTLSISLHATNDSTRSNIMPINKRHNLQELLGACKRYFAKTGRRISYEYALIDGVNDTTAEARALAKLVRGQNCHVNLIPINAVKERSTKRSTPENVAKFRAELEKQGINATIRRELGKDIDAACGQLRRNHNKKV